MALSPTKQTGQPSGSPLLRDAIAMGRQPLLYAGLFSLVSNLLYLALPLYTTQVYGRVLISHSGSTLWMLTAGAVFVFLVSAAIDNFRGQILTGFGEVFDQRVAGSVFAAIFDTRDNRPGSGSQALRDLDTVRQTIGGPGIGVLFDLPWIPVFLVILFIIDPIIGAVTLFGGLTLVGLTWLQDRATHRPLKDANDASLQSYAFAEAAMRNAEVVRALGMLPTLGRQWTVLRHRAITATTSAAEGSSFYAGAIRFVRMTIQIATIAVGAWLIIDGIIPAGLLFANMILSARAMAPLERVMGAWNGLFAASQAYKRLDGVLAGYEPPVPATRLPTPTGRLAVEQVNFAPPGAAALVLINTNFRMEAGETIGVIGPSGAGKSTLARLIVGIWRPLNGSVRLDGADVYGWDRDDFGRNVSYLPQDVELFGGTVRDNIARFRADATDEQVVAAARMAGAHELVLRMANGYETELRPGGVVLSAGQRQRIGLARALFGEPRLIVLDEPNASLDAEGEAALMTAMEAAKGRGVSVVIISHKPGIFRLADKLLLLTPGQPSQFGARDDVLAHLAGNNRRAARQVEGDAAAKPAPAPAPAAPPAPAKAAGIPFKVVPAAAAPDETPSAKAQP